jgi:hypothetical protein
MGYAWCFYLTKINREVHEVAQVGVEDREPALWCGEYLNTTSPSESPVTSAPTATTRPTFAYP